MNAISSLSYIKLLKYKQNPVSVRYRTQMSNKTGERGINERLFNGDSTSKGH